MTGLLILDKVLIDYARLTTRNEDVGVQWRNEQIQAAIREKRVMRKAQFLQFVGESLAASVGGHIFYGEWQRDVERWGLLQASGSTSDEWGRWMTRNMSSWGCKCTRIDLQVTVAEPRGWKQWDLLERLKEKGRNVSYVTSTDTETKKDLATVYIGSKNSERLLRIYEKLTVDGHKLLRFEAEYKGKRADSVARMLGKNLGKATDYIAYELETQKDDALTVLFASAIVGANPDRGRFARVKTSLDKQGDWLLKGVLTAFERYINDHDANPIVAEQFQKALTVSQDTWDIDGMYTE